MNIKFSLNFSLNIYSLSIIYIYLFNKAFKLEWGSTRMNPWNEKYFLPNRDPQRTAATNAVRNYPSNHSKPISIRKSIKRKIKNRVLVRYRQLKNNSLKVSCKKNEALNQKLWIFPPKKAKNLQNKQKTSRYSSRRL